MQKRYATALLLCFLALLAGCVSYPSETLVQPWPSEPPPGYAMVMVYSTQKGGRGPTVFIDDTEVFRIPGISYSWVYVSAGEHALKTKYWMMFHGLDMDKKLSFRAGENYFFKTAMWQGKSPAPGFVISVQAATFRVKQDKAEVEAKKCWYRKPKVPRVGGKAVASATAPGN